MYAIIGHCETSNSIDSTSWIATVTAAAAVYLVSACRFNALLMYLVQ